MTPLVHLTLPPFGVYSPESHFAPLVFMLEGLVKVNEHHINQSFRRAKAGLGSPIPPLFSTGIRYQEDPPGKENWRDIYAILAHVAKGAKGVDCLPLSTLVLRDDYETVPLISLRPGDKIFGGDAWTTVLETIPTGPRPILTFRLSNGCTLRCTPEHRIFRDVDGRTEEIRAGEARIGDDLITPTSIPLAQTDGIGWPGPMAKLSDEDRSWLLGVFVADGWVFHDNRAGVGAREPRTLGISGLDGAPKEVQKRRVEDLMRAVGVTTRWDRKSIGINDRDLAKFFSKCGHLAPNKHLDSLCFASESQVRAVLDGLAADAGYSETGNPESALVYGTTSPQLALQLRVLYRMLGVSTSISRVADHGGFGEHAIYRVIPRLHMKQRGREHWAERRDKKFARIREIADGGTEICGDIATDAGKFWLPESDVLVHNCDQLVCWRVAELRCAGIRAEPVIKWQHLPREVAIKLGFKSEFVPDEGLWLVHCCVRFPNGDVEDTSKLLGMGGSFTSKA